MQQQHHFSLQTALGSPQEKAGSEVRVGLAHKRPHKCLLQTFGPQASRDEKGRNTGMNATSTGSGSGTKPAMGRLKRPAQTMVFKEAPSFIFSFIRKLLS